MITVLMVDNQQVVVDILNQILEHVGFRVTQASTGKEARGAIAS